jgi:hypothetical protein
LSATPALNFVTSINDNGGKCAAGVFDTGGSPTVAFIFATFRKNENDPNEYCKEKSKNH